MESINPKDFSEIDISTIEYLTLKNGNMILLDETAPEMKNKANKNKNDFQKFNNFNILTISEPIVISFASLLNKHSLINNIKHNNNYSIFKNDNFVIINSKFNYKKNNFFDKGYNKNDLNQLRNKIDEIDKIIIEAFLERMKIVTDISNYKKRNKLPIYDSLRESELLSKRKGMVNDISFHKDIEDLFKLILKISKEHQSSDQNNIQAKKNHNNFKEFDYEPTNKVNKLNLDEININNSNNNNNNNNLAGNNNEIGSHRNEALNHIYERRIKRLKTLEENKKMKEKYIKGRNNSNLINAVCSLNIPSDNPKSINLIAKFNNLVDKLNDQKYKNYKEKEIQENEKINNNKIYYHNIKNKNILNKNNEYKRCIRSNIFNICENQNLKEYDSYSQISNNSKNITFNKTRIFDRTKNINNSKIKICEFKTNRTFRNNNAKFLKYKRNNSSVVLPSNNYYY